MRIIKRMKNPKGFTLVELLVVLAIVGILMGLAIGGIRIVQEVNRDTQRKALVRDIQLALESYQEKNNAYPDTGDLNLTEEDDRVQIDADGEVVDSSVNFDVEPLFTGGTDCTLPKMNGSESESGYFSYCYRGESRGYELIVKLERSSEAYSGGNV